MRNLKRALSLAVASVMLVGMMVVGTGASYADVASTDNVEAIEVLQKVGIMTGDDKGNFNPDAKVSRNEMAVVMCNLLDYTVASYKGTSPFTDVPEWAEPYVAACYTNGIIAGYSATIYGGSDTVTTAQAGLMLMKALGYFQEPGDFSQDWMVSTISQGSKAGIFDDVDAAARDALTRSEAAQMVMNALQAEMVEISDHDLTANANGNLTTKAVYAARTNSNNKYGKIDDERSDNNGKYIIQLGEDLYSGDLERKDKTDDFGRPGTQWKYKGSEIGTYADSADDVMVINKSLNAQQILVTDSDYFDYNSDDLADTLAVYINGDKVTNATTYSTLTNAALQAGDVVELYENDDDEIETVAVTRYSLAKIDEIETSLSSTYTNRGASCSIELKNLSDSSVGAGTYYDVYDSDSARELSGFAESTYTEGTVLAVALKSSNNAILSSHVAGSAEGAITAYNSGSKANVTLDGAKYSLHGVVDTTSSANQAMNSLSFNYNDSTYTVYTDVNNYVVGIDETESVKLEDVYYVTGLGKEAGAYSSNVYAQAVSLVDGSVTEFKLKTSDADTAKAFFGASGAATSFNSVTAGSIYTTSPVTGLYTFDKDGGSYTAEKYVGKISGTAQSYQSTDSSNYVFATSGTGVPAAITDDLAKDDTSIKLSGVSGRFYLNNSTNYLKVEDDGDDLDVKFITGGTSAKNNNLTAIVVATKSNNNYVAKYVVLVSDNFANAGSDDVVFVHERSSTTASYTDADGKTKTGYQTELWFLDGSGSKETVTTDQRYAAGFYTWEINDDDVYELTDDVDSLWSQMTVASGNTYDYDDETGHVGFQAANNDFASGSGRLLTGIYGNALSAQSFTSQQGGTVNLDDVAFADNVIIGDDRGKATRDGDMYTSEITSVSQLKTAIDKTGNQVKAVLYYDDGKVVMVYVLSMSQASGGGSGSSQNATYSVSLAKKADTATGEIELTVASTDTSDNATTYTAKVYAYGITSGRDTAVEVGSVATQTLSNGTSTVTVANNTNNTLIFYVVVTLSDGSVLTTSTLIGG